MSKTSNLYLYLARRDGTGVRIISTMRGKEQVAVRLKDIGVLQLPANVRQAVEQMIYDDRMLWEPWIESAESFDVLKARLKKRGFSGLPLSGHPAILSGLIASPPTVTVNNLPKKNTMVRKKG